MKDNEIVHNTWTGYLDGGEIDPIAGLEKECWAGWLAASPDSLRGRTEVFPDGQLCVYSNQGLLATLSVNRISWDGNKSSLPTWDEVAGEPTTYEETFVEHGNALCLMSMNVSKIGRGKHLPSVLIGSLLEFAQNSGVEFVIGSFRPSAYSKAVVDAIENVQKPPEFEEYCKMTNENGELVDPWLRSLSKNGMQPIAVDHNAMFIPVTKDEFNSVKKPSWKLIDLNGQKAWLCGETGFFYEKTDGSYVYKESNLWGSLNAKK